MANTEGVPAGSGCLSPIIGAVALVAIVVVVIFVGFIALGVVAALLVLGLLVWAGDRVMLALSPKRRERRANQRRVFVWRFGQEQPGEVIDTTAIETTESSDDVGQQEQKRDELGPE